MQNNFKRHFGNSYKLFNDGSSYIHRLLNEQFFFNRKRFFFSFPFFFVEMAWCKLILYLSLLHRFSFCLRASEVVLSSQNLSALENSVVNANVRENFTEQFVRVEDGSGFPSKNTSEKHRNLDRVLKIWDPIAVSSVWNNETYQDAGVSQSCGEDLTHYLTGVSNGANWALRSK